MSTILGLIAKCIAYGHTNPIVKPGLTPGTCRVVPVDEIANCPVKADNKIARGNPPADAVFDYARTTTSQQVYADVAKGCQGLATDKLTNFYYVIH